MQYIPIKFNFKNSVNTYVTKAGRSSDLKEKKIKISFFYKIIDKHWVHIKGNCVELQSKFIEKYFTLCCPDKL